MGAQAAACQKHPVHEKKPFHEKHPTLPCWAAPQERAHLQQRAVDVACHRHVEQGNDHSGQGQGQADRHVADLDVCRGAAAAAQERRKRAGDERDRFSSMLNCVDDSNAIIMLSSTLIQAEEPLRQRRGPTRSGQ